MGVVYKVKNLINGKVYVGSTIRTLSERRSQHVHAYHREYSSPFDVALSQYGADNFEWKVLYESDMDQLLRNKEQTFIETFHSDDPTKGYNVPTYRRVCPYCNRTFTTNKKNAICCSVVHYNAYYYDRRHDDSTDPSYRKVKKCPGCGALFVTTRDKRRYCYNKTCAKKAKSDRDKKRREQT
jgi:group I intron endonuclease